MPAQPLPLNASISNIPIRARERWNPLGVLARPKEKFRFACSGRWIDWKDEPGPDGHAGNSIQRLANWTKRMPSAPWFATIGALGQRSDCMFLIGADNEWTNPTDRTEELFAFANDAWFFYWNNHGEISLEITRIG